MKRRQSHTTAARCIALALLALSSTVLAGSGDKDSAPQLLEQFRSSTVFWEQFKIGEKIVALHDTTVLPALAGWLHHEDRHIRGNVAFIFAGLGDDWGLEVIREILADRSYRPEGQGMATASSDGRYRVELQVKADRYYAVHLLGDLKDSRGVPDLVPLLKDEEVNYIVPWSLAEMGDRRANTALIEALGDRNPSIRVLSIYALEKLGAKEALPHLHKLLKDKARANVDRMSSVSEAAATAIARLEAEP